MSDLHDAARGDDGEVRRMLERGANVDARTADGWTPLHVAAALSYTETAALLREHGATEEVPPCTD